MNFKILRKGDFFCVLNMSYLYTMSRLIVVFFLFISLRHSSVAQVTDSLELRSKVLNLINTDSLTINKNQVSTLAAFEERDSREVPGSLLIITEDDIAAMNAKDLMDVLMMTTNISLGRDVEDGIGIGIRGNWAQEGKVLFLINGVPVNDLDYGTYNLGGRVSLSMVSRIEITMGPGSVKYGGTAALGVINVVLKSNSEFLGSMVEGDLNYSRGINTRKSFSYFGNYAINNKYKLSVGFNTTKTLRSTVYQILPDGDTLSWADSSQVESIYFNIGLQRNRFRSNIYFSNYQYNVSDAQNSVLMRQLGADLQWSDKLAPHTKIKYQFLFQDQLPWFDINTADSAFYNSNTRAQKSQLNVALNSKIRSNLFFDYGFQAYQQRSTIVMRGQQFNINGENSTSIEDAALYAEVFYRSKIGSFVLGARMETHTYSKLQFAPRIAYSKIFKRFYIKAMFSEAFKIPTLQNFNNAPEESSLKSENVQMYEASIGGKFFERLEWEGSIFKSEISNPIVYVFDGNNDNYLNRSHAGTEGFDAWVAWRGGKSQLKISGSFYRVIPNSNFEDVEVHLDESSYWAMPNYRVSAQGSLRIKQDISVHAAAILQDKLWVDYLPGNPIMNDAVINLSVSKQSAKIKNLNFNVGITNLLNGDFWIGSPYASEISVMPIYQRQFCVSMRYKLD